jgi:signal transduction histidine kinase
MRFTLRQKIATVFVLLLVIAATVGLLSIQRFNQLGLSIDVILKENYRSVVACQDMNDALERIDSGLLFILSGFVREGLEQVAANRTRFQDALRRELDNLTLPGEAEKAQGLRVLFEGYSGQIDAFMATAPGERGRRYFETLLPQFLRIKEQNRSILRMNQENMNLANDKARMKAVQARRDMILLLSLSALVALSFMFFSNHWILRPIRGLIATTQEVRAGNLNLTIHSEAGDEIGQLSEAFNAMVSSLRLFRRSDQEKLNRAQRSTQEAFLHLPTAMAIIDAKGDVEVATASAQTQFGLVPGIPVEQAPYPSLAVLHRLAQSAHAGESGQEIIQQFRDGREKFYRPRAVAIRDAEKEFRGSILIVEDVTLLLQNDEIKKDLFSTISHQLKTPLTSIRMALHLLLEENIGSLNEKQADLLVSAREESDRLNGIIDDLLEIRRLEAGSTRLQLEALPAGELVAEAVAPFQRSAQDKGVRIETDVPAGLPAVRADRSRILYVFANLLSNAVKYSPVGGIVRLTAQWESGRIRFSVRDEGAGIPQEFQSRIFEKFFRVPGQATEAGAGLGLSIAREIVTSHGGTISFQSSAAGSEFVFTLPPDESSGEGGLS